MLYDNIYVWMGLIVMIVIALFVKGSNKKPFCTAHIYEIMNGLFIQHTGLYNCAIKNANNKAKDKLIYWTEISKTEGFLDNIKMMLGIHKKMLWRPLTHKDTIPRKDGSRHVNLLWLGKNDFRVINLKIHEYEIEKVRFNKEANTYEAKVNKSNNIYLDVIDDEDHYFLAEMYDKLEDIYRMPETWLQEIMKYLPLAIIALACIGMVYLSVTKTGKTQENIANIQAKAMGEAIVEQKNFGEKLLSLIDKSEKDNNLVKSGDNG